MSNRIATVARVNVAANTLYSQPLTFVESISVAVLAPVGWSGGPVSVYVSPLEHTTPAPHYTSGGSLLQANNGSELVGGQSYNIASDEIMPVSYIWFVASTLQSSPKQLVAQMK